MTYWTALFITILSGPLEGTTMAIAYPSLQACEAATRQVSATLSYDHSLDCQESTTASASIRPKNRGNN
jgi:hypothetical protein